MPDEMATTRGGKLMYAARTRNGFTPKLRAELLKAYSS